MSQKLLLLANILSRYRISHSTESEMQLGIVAAFENEQIEFEREARLSNKDIVDFLVGGIAVECKTKGSPQAIFKQVKRYLEYDSVEGLILFTAKHMGLPDTFNGKHLIVIKAGASWL